MGTKRLGLFIWLFLLAAATPARSEFFQWTDAQGVIHFTDNFQSVPESLRDSPLLITRKDGDFRGSFSEISVPEVSTQGFPSAPHEPQMPEATMPEAGAPSQPTLHYNPHEITIIVVNNAVRSRHKHPCHIGKNCQPIFRPNFEDRRFIHPSVFDGGSRQFVHPGSFRSVRSGKVVPKK